MPHSEGHRNLVLPESYILYFQESKSKQGSTEFKWNPKPYKVSWELILSQCVSWINSWPGPYILHWKTALLCRQPKIHTVDRGSDLTRPSWDTQAVPICSLARRLLYARKADLFRLSGSLACHVILPAFAPTMTASAMMLLSQILLHCLESRPSELWAK